MNKTISIPKSLHEFHGEESTIFSLILTYVSGIILASAVLLFYQFYDLTLWRQILLILICFDIGGGIVSNFTQGTREYYSKNRKRRWAFLSLHLLYPVLFYLIFPGLIVKFIIPIALILIGSAIINLFYDMDNQKPVGALIYSLIIISLIYSLSDQPLLLTVLLAMAFKLNIAWGLK